MWGVNEVAQMEYHSYGDLEVPFTNYYDRTGHLVTHVKDMVSGESYWLDISDIEFLPTPCEIEERSKENGIKTRHAFEARLKKTYSET